MAVPNGMLQHQKKKKSLDCAFALVKFCSLPNIYEHLQPGNANASQKS